MSIENVKEFIKKLNTDSELKDKISGKTIDEATHFASELGLDFTKDELINFLHENNKQEGLELSEEDLNKISGGATPMTEGAAYSCFCTLSSCK